MRIALIMDHAPRKLGSFEAFLLGFAEDATRRGHRVTMYGREPVHELVRTRLASAGVSWQLADDLERHPVRATQLLRAQYDVVHLDFFAPRQRMSLLAYAAWPTRVLLADHMVSIALPWQQRPRPLASRMLDRVTMCRVGGIACVSEHVRRRNLERFRVAPTRARTIYMGIDAERYRPAAEPRENTGPLRILAAAMLAPWKAVDVLIRAFAALEDIPAQLLIAGDGPDAESLRTLAASLGVGSRVSFAGLRDDIDVLMREADVFVQPSYREALGLSLVEAMASGCAVIGSDVGGIPEVIDNEVTGLVVPAGDVQALAAALRRLASDDELRRRFGERGRARVLERFTLASAVEQHVAWCEELGEAALRQ